MKKRHGPAGYYYHLWLYLTRLRTLTMPQLKPEPEHDWIMGNFTWELPDYTPSAEECQDWFNQGEQP